MIVSALLQVAPVAIAHSGGTDASGCHTNKKTSEYHCHEKPKAKLAKTEARSTAPQGKKTIICTANVYNCSDFGGSHAVAQSTYQFCVEQAGKDMHDLDRDRDGVACEDLQ